MATKTNHKKKKKSAGIDLTLYFYILCGIGLLLTFFIFHKYTTELAHRKIFYYNVIPLLAGLLLENYRLSKNWRKVLLLAFFVYILSFLCFLPGRHEIYYVFSKHLQLWPYFFMFMFCLLSMFFYEKEVTFKLTEGITLIQSISIIYWTLDAGFFIIGNWFIRILLVILILFSLFSIYNAFSYRRLTKNTRLMLSIWSTMIMVVFAIDNIIYIFYHQIEYSFSWYYGLSIGLQYFLLGMSAVYIMRNIWLLLSFLPDRDYREQIRQNVKDHIERYSFYQINIVEAVFCVCYTVFFYGINYVFHLLPRFTMIWLVMFSFPFILNLTLGMAWTLRRTKYS